MLKEKRRNAEWICEECGTKIDKTLYGKRVDRCDTCVRANRERKLRQQRELSLTKIQDYVVCRLCHERFKSISTDHLRFRHGIEFKEYQTKFPEAKILSESTAKIYSERYRDQKNPAYNHGGKFSPFSKKFVKGDISEQTKKKAAESIRNSDKLDTRLDFWLKQTDGNEEKAKELLRQRQSTFSLEKCIAKFGEKEGREKWLARQEKWVKSFKKHNFSQISQELFNAVMKEFQEKDVFYATYTNPLFDPYPDFKNKEFRLKLSNKMVLPDFFVLKTKKIIEFDGDYWHTEAIANETKEKERQNLIEAEGYTVFRVKEFKYKQDKQKVVQECLTFLQS